MASFEHSFNEVNAVKAHFVTDQKAAIQCCTAAREAMSSGDNPSAHKLLLQALTVRPSSMLAYQLMSELFANEGRAEDAALCRKGIVPADVLDQLPQRVIVAKNTTFVESSLLGVERQQLFAAQRVNLPAAGGVAVHKNIIEPSKPAFFNERTIFAKECFVDRIGEGTLWHDAQHTLVQDASWREVAEHSKCDHGLIQSLMRCHKPKRLEGRAFLIGARGSHNFYHWMVDILPKLAVLKAAGFIFDSRDQFIVPFANAEFCMQMVQQFGIDPSQLYETEKQYAYLQADELIVPFVDNKMGLTMGPWLPILMKEHFTQNAHVNRHNDEIGAGKRIFITREKQSADGRVIENQDELLEFLLQRGFESVQPEKLSVAQQAQLFSEASVVLAAHGAALSNVLFCPPGTAVIEFYGAHLAPCYWAISALCELDYYHQYCGISNEASHGTSVGRSGNLNVPLLELGDLLSEAGVV